MAYNIHPTVSALPEGIDTRDRLLLPVSLDQGVNSFGTVGYSGPMPPIGHGRHHYHFILYALNSPLGIPPKGDYLMFREAIEGHVLAVAELTGIFERDLHQSVMT
jgi:Raf kinase inhibitor-like YbhB/YbcL family protein